MKKCYTKLTDLAKDDVNYPNENYISALDIFRIYLNGYSKCEESLNNYTGYQNRQSISGYDLFAKYSYDGKYIIVDIMDNKSNKVLATLKCDYNKFGEVKLLNVSSSNSIDSRVVDEYYNNFLINEIKEYGAQYVSLMRNYDCSHNAIYSTNSKFSLYLVDNEAILFIDCSYFSVTLNDDKELVFNTHNANLVNKLGLEQSKEKILKNVYFNIDDAPLFIRDELYRFRLQQLENNSSLSNNNQSLKRKPNWLRK